MPTSALHAPLAALTAQIAGRPLDATLDAWLNAEFARPPSESNWQYLLDKGIAANLDNRNSAVGSDNCCHNIA